MVFNEQCGNNHAEHQRYEILAWFRGIPVACALQAEYRNLGMIPASKKEQTI